ncbi:MAG: restriction endonuclease subunit S [Opitutales bacterium]|nr:restriction endonuclease subunit S [Opitutales bacterium]
MTDKRDLADSVYKYPVAGAAGIIGYAKEENQHSRFLTTGRVGTIGIVNKYDEPCWTADNVLVVKSDFYEYVYQYLKGFKYEEIMKGGVQSLITQSSLNEAEILIPDVPALELYERKAQSISHLVKLKKQEISNLTNFLSLLLARMGKDSSL